MSVKVSARENVNILKSLNRFSGVEYVCKGCHNGYKSLVGAHRHQVGPLAGPSCSPVPGVRINF